MKLGLFGGTFDPVHTGHLILAESLASAAGLARVLFVPAGLAPHKTHRPPTSFEHRLAMVRMAILGNPAFDVADLEGRREGPSYTIDTVLAYEARGEREIVLLVGSDTVKEIPTWRRAREILERVALAVGRRPGTDPEALRGPLEALAPAGGLRLSVHPTPEVEISGTVVRARVAAGQSVRYLVPEAVRSYIATEGLYREA